MRLKILIILQLIFTVTCYAQDAQIVLSEKKRGKRIVLVAENKTTDTLNVFLMVISEGYRRSADRPVIKNIPPLSKTPMITLIELSNVPSSYAYELIINDKEYDLTSLPKKKVNDIEKNINGKLVIFTKDECEKCVALSESLEMRKIGHRTFNINEDPILYKQFIVFIEKEFTLEVRIKFPVIWNKDHAIFGFEDLENMLSVLSEE